MSAALINRSLTTIRTELEFLFDSDVIDKSLFDTLVKALPQKYSKDMQPWSTDKIDVGDQNKTQAKGEVDDVSQSLAAVTVQDAISTPHPPAPLPPREKPVAIGYCKASFVYDAQEQGDLPLAKDDRVAVLEHLSPDWWKGYKQLDPSKVGVFPSNYVSVISDAEFQESAKAANENATFNPEKTEAYTAPPPAYPPPGQGGYAVQQRPSYGGYAQFPPPSTNYYPPQQQQQQQQQQQLLQLLAPPQEVQQQNSGSTHPHLKKFGSKLGNAAIFGAGATLGSDLINLIF